jgi:hypothetical protein
MNRQIVVCRYNEDISWTKSLENVIIYNKGEAVKSNHKVINLPNLGMFHGSQLYHIIENYDNLADITLFIQGWPFDGEFEKHKNLKNDAKGLNYIIEYYSSIPKGSILSVNTHQQYIKNLFECPPNYNQRHHNEFIKYTFNWKEWLALIDPYSRIDWDKKMPFYRNGHIGISKEAILSNPKEYYILLIDHWKYSNPLAEWITESTQSFIFNSDLKGKYIDYRHADLDFSNLKNYKEWFYEL